MFAAALKGILITFLCLASMTGVCRADESVSILNVHSRVVEKSEDYAYVAWEAEIISDLDTRAFFTMSFFGTKGFRLRYFIDLVELQKGRNRINGVERMEWYQYWDLLDIQAEVDILGP